MEESKSGCLSRLKRISRKVSYLENKRREEGLILALLTGTSFELFRAKNKQMKVIQSLLMTDQVRQEQQPINMKVIG